MPPILTALIDYGHLLGVVLGVGGLLQLTLVLLPASRELDEPHRTQLLAAARARGSRITFGAVGLILVTGILKWMPYTGGVGWLGARGLRTGFLHAKIVLALLVFYFAIKLARAPRDRAAAARRPGIARLAAMLGLVVMLLAVLHKTGL